MVNKRQPAAQAGPGLVGKTSPPATTITSSPTTLSSRASSREIIQHIWQRYLAETPQRTFLLDAFMIFLVIVGGVQFLYCVLAGNFPFNAFLSGFCAAVGQFVLTASLRMQTSQVAGSGSTDQSATLHERAFADYIFGSLILHFFCINFIN
ncbi:hypothetical protein VTN31DRAFT_2025 [Thermomyces dupontii]|uniref:uncharacterized protein n=1 Tax=Talaromyces thermophilus TaxID=28565 RepID=UPI003741F0A0